MTTIETREQIFRLVIEADAQKISDMTGSLTDDESDACLLYGVGWALTYAKPPRYAEAVRYLQRAVNLTTSPAIRSGCIYALAEAGEVGLARREAARLAASASDAWEREMYGKLLDSHPTIGKRD